MTDRRPPPPPSLGTYRPTQDRARNDRTQDPRRPVEPDEHRLSHGYPNTPQQSYPPVEDHRQEQEGMPRIVTSRVRTGPPPPPSAMPRAAQRTRRPPPPPADEEGSGWLRILGYSLLGLVAFVAAAAVAAFLFVPTGLIHDRLQAEVKARTGRDLVIAGPTSLSLWPRPAVSMRDVTLSAPRDMGAQPLLKVAEIEVAVQILPLLLHDVNVDRLLLRKPEFDLRIDQNGRKSWEFSALQLPGEFGGPVRLAQAATGDTKTLPKELQDFMKGSSEPANRGLAPAGRSRVGDVSLGNVRIVDGIVHYRDQRSAVDETLSGVNAQFALANIASPLDIDGSFDWRGENVQLKSQISPFRALLDGRPIETKVRSSAAPLKVSFEGVVTQGAEIDLDGRLTAEAASAEKAARWIGKPLNGVLPGGFAIEARIKQTTTLTDLREANIAIGPVKGNGALSVDTRNGRPYVKGAIHVATLDFNVLQAVADASPPSAPATAQPSADASQTDAPKSIEDLLKSDTASSSPPALPTSRKSQVRGYTKRQGWSDEPIDLSALGLFDSDVRVGFDRIVWHDMTTGAGQINLVAKSKAARISLDDIQLYDGRARGIVTIDATTPELLVGANMLAEGVSALPFLKGISDFDWISGRARIALAFAGRGATERQIVSTLNGKTDIAVADGALMGLNFANIIGHIGKGKLGLERSPNEKTEFSEFAASAQITNGIARNDDLRLTSAQLRVTGAGTIDLPQRTMDYMLRPKVTSGIGAGIDVPLRLTGSIDKPTVTPELASINPQQAVQAIQEAAKTPAGREIQDTIKGAIAGDPAATNKVKGFLDQLFKK